MKTISLLLIISILINGCGIITPIVQSKGKLSDIQVRMTKEEIKDKMGSPDEIRGSVINENGKVVTVWQYRLYNGGQPFINFFAGIFLLTVTWWVPLANQGDNYWLYFVEDNLAQWGQAGDWREDVIMKVKIQNEK